MGAPPPAEGCLKGEGLASYFPRRTLLTPLRILFPFYSHFVPTSPRVLPCPLPVSPHSCRTFTRTPIHPSLTCNTHLHVHQILKDATRFFSRKNPNIAMVVPAMDFIDETFTNGILNETELDPAIRTAIKLAKKTLNRYYGLMDASEVYRIAMGEYSSIYKDQTPDNDSLSHV